MITRKPLDIVGAKWLSQQDSAHIPDDWVICEDDGSDLGGFVMCRQRMDERFTDERREVWDRAAECMTALANLNPAAVQEAVEAFETTLEVLESIKRRDPLMSETHVEILAHARAALTALRQPADAKGGTANEGNA